MQHHDPNSTILTVIALAVAILTLVITAAMPVLGPAAALTAAAGLGCGLTGYWAGRRQGTDERP